MNLDTSHSPTGGWSTIFRRDLPASIVVFLVALPLCMGVAIASNMPVAAGLVTGIVGGILVGFLGGSPLQVSGPAAGLTVLVYELVQSHGIETIGLVVLIGGGIQLLAGFLRVGQWFRAVSPAVVEGMLAGIGLLILSNQFQVMVDSPPKSTGIGNLIAIPEAIVKGLPLPEWSSAESRQQQVTALKAFGTLHADQQQIVESVGRIVPHDAPLSDLPKLGEGLAELAEPQARIRAELAVWRERLETDYQHAFSGERRETIQANLDHALVLLANAEQSLAKEDAISVNESQKLAEESVLAVERAMRNHDWAAKVGFLTIALIIGWSLIPWSFFKVIPGPLVAVCTATIGCTLLALPVLYVEVPQNLLSDLHSPSWIVIQEADWWALLTAGGMLAIIASAETLLCCTAVDQMHGGASTKYDRELMAQGMGNMVCGSLGALPMTGVIVRSAANVQSGAKTRASAILHGVWILAFAVFLGQFLNLIPKASLAAMLVYTGWRLVNFKMLGELWRVSKADFLICLTTIVVIVVEDLLIGVATGVVLSAARMLAKFSNLQVTLHWQESPRKAIVRVDGAATFLRLPRLATILEQIPPGTAVEFDMSRMTVIDHACLNLVANWRRRHEGQGGIVHLDWGRVQDAYEARKLPHEVVEMENSRMLAVSNKTSH